MKETLSALLAVVMVIIALGFAYQVFVFIRIFLHESTNFYQRVSAIVLCAGLVLRIALVLIDSFFRFKHEDAAWQQHVQAAGVVTYLLIFNPMIIFTIPVFAIICDWTDALALLNNDGQIDREKYQAKQSRIKNIFLGVSTLIIVAMWTNMAGEILDIEVNWNSWPTFYSIVNVLTWAFSLFICLFMLAVTLQIIVLYTQVMKVLNNIRKLIVQHNQDIKQELGITEAPLEEAHSRTDPYEQSFISYSSAGTAKLKTPTLSAGTNVSTKPGIDDSIVKLTDLGDNEQIRKLNVIYQMKRDDFNQVQSKSEIRSDGSNQLNIPVGDALSLSYRSARKVRLDKEQSTPVSLNGSDDVKHLKQVADPRPADWRMREIIRNLTIAFIVLVTLMLLMVYISVIFLLHVWQINPLGVDQFRVWDIISLVSQMLLCLLFNYYFFKMKAFYTPTVLEADKEEEKAQDNYELVEPEQELLINGSDQASSRPKSLRMNEPLMSSTESFSKNMVNSHESKRSFIDTKRVSNTDPKRISFVMDNNRTSGLLRASTLVRPNDRQTIGNTGMTDRDSMMGDRQTVIRPNMHNESVVTIEESDEDNNEFISRVDVLSPRATFMRLSFDQNQKQFNDENDADQSIMVTDGFDIEDFDRMAAKQKHDLADSAASEEQLFSYRKKPFLN